MTPPPMEPPPSLWALEPDWDHPLVSESDLVGIGADLRPGTLLQAYRIGLFPMGVPDVDGIGWWSPLERGVLDPAQLRVSKSLRRSARLGTVTVDRAFDEVIMGCAYSGRTGDWITEEIIEAYYRLFHMGWVHSVECWREGRLVGGLYGVALGGLFAGESMFHHETDGSKVALMGLCDVMGGAGPRMIDTQWNTDHLATLGVEEIPRDAYRAALPELAAAPGPSWAAVAAAEWVAGSPPDFGSAEPSTRTR